MSTQKTAIPPAASALSRENLLTAARLLAGLVFAGLAGHALRIRNAPVDAALFLVAAVAFFLWGIRRAGWSAPSWPALAEEGPIGRDRLTWIGFGLLAAAVSWPLFAGNTVRPLGVLLLAGGLYAVVHASRQNGPRPPLAHEDLLSPRARWLALLAIVLLAAFFRLYKIDTIPGDMFNDLAHNYEETRLIMQGHLPVYATGFPGREPLLFYLTAPLAALLGLNFLTLKLITVILGIATVPVVYLLGREAYNDMTGLVAALFLAVAKWHVLISRVGFRGILTPLLAALVLYFLLRGLKGGRRGDLLAAGAFVGLGLYGYTSSLAVILAVPVALGVYALAGHVHDLWRVRRSLLLAVLVALVVALPMIRYMTVDDPDAFWFRALTRVSSREAPIQGPVLPILVQNLVHAAGMFNVRGDVVFRTNVPYDPHLDVVAGALFLLGIPLALMLWRKQGNAVVLSFFLVLLLPTTLALAFPQEVPGAVRSGGALATVMLFPAAAVVLAWRQIGEMVPALRSRWGWAALLAVLALWSGLYNARLVFQAYPQALPMGNYPLYREMAHAVDELGDDGPVLLKDVPYWSDKDAIRLQTQYHQEWGDRGEAMLADQPWDPAAIRALGPQVSIIFNPADEATRTFLHTEFPAGVEVAYRDQVGAVQFVVYIFKTSPQSQVPSPK